MTETATNIVARPDWVVERLATALPRYRYRFKDEKTFQDGIASALDELGIQRRRDKRVLRGAGRRSGKRRGE